VQKPRQPLLRVGAHKQNIPPERYAQKQNIEDRYKSIQLNNEKENSICLKSY